MNNSSEVFTLYLQTNNQDNTATTNPITPIDVSNRSNITWNIDFDNLFNLKNKNNQYKFCRVRYHLTTNRFPLGSLGYDDGLGYLACNLRTDNSLITCNNTILGLVYLQPINIVGFTDLCYVSNTLEEKGVDIIIPQGTQYFTLSFFNLTNTFISNINTNGYQILIQFELYN